MVVQVYLTESKNLLGVVQLQNLNYH